jgi:small subunit ribosomal protein S30e
MEKKKKKTGRAKKRIQYNRRFVTAVVGFGAKRGVFIILSVFTL